MYDVFFNCPFEDVNEKTKARLDDYVKMLEDDGKKVFYPIRDSESLFPRYNILEAKQEAISGSKEMHIWYDGTDAHVPFYTGIGVAEKVKLIHANPEDIDKLDEEQHDFITRVFPVES